MSLHDRYSLRSAEKREQGPTRWTPPAFAGRDPTVWIAANLAVALGYFALGLVVSRFFAAYGLFPAPIWLPASIAIVAAMIGGVRMLPGIFLGSFLANDVLFAPPLHITAIISATNALGPIVGVLALQRIHTTGGLFTSFRGVAAFVACTTFLAPAISGAGGALALAIGKPFDIAATMSVWLNWLMTDSGGTLYLAPAMLMWLGVGREPPGEPVETRFGNRDRAIWIAVAATILALFLLPSIILGGIRALLPFLLVVPLSWIALRISLRSAYTLVSLLAVVATAGAVIGVGPFQDSALANPLQLVGLLVVLLAMNVLTVVALFSERQEAQRARMAKSMLLARTSHELRTPLNAVIGFSSLIDQQAFGPLENEKYLEYARIIQSSGENLLALVNDLIDLSRIDAGRYELHEERVDVAAAMHEAVSLIDVQARARSIALTTAPTAADLWVTADRRALWQVLINILSNAVKFTPEGGSVCTSAAIDRAGDLVIRIADTGAGIDAETLARLGAPFERAHHDADEAIEGSGLGLSIAKGLIALHGGTLVLDSAPGEGTTVSIVLPGRRVGKSTNDSEFALVTSA